MVALHRAAFVFVAAATAAAFACGEFGTDDGPAGSDAGPDGSTSEAASVDAGADASNACTPQPLGPPPPEDPRCGSNGPSFDLETSDIHCGACNHSCLGGGCENGVCKAVDLAPPLDNGQYQQAAFATLPLAGIHYGDALAIKRLAVDGGSAEVLGDLVDGGGAARFMSSLSSDGIRIVFTVPASGVYTIPVEGGPITAVPGAASPTNAVIVNGDVYWSTFSEIYLSAGGGAKSWAKEAAKLVGFTADASTLYWAAQPLVDGSASGNVTIKMSAAGAVVNTKIRATVGDAGGLVVKDGYLYWFDRTTRKVYRADVTKSDEPTPIAELPASDRTRLRALAVDATHVYWAMSHPDYNMSSFFKVSRCGGPTMRIADETLNDLGIALDDRYIYFSGINVPLNTIGIRRVAK